MMDYYSYSSYRGLQKPLEFMGLKGRYLYVAAGCIGGGILSFIIAFLIAGFWVAFILTLSSLLLGGTWIFLRQKKGLHTKTINKGTFVTTHLIQFKS